MLYVKDGKLRVNSSNELVKSCGWYGVECNFCGSPPSIILISFGSYKVLDSSYSDLNNVALCRMISLNPIKIVILGNLSEYDEDLGSIITNWYLKCYDEDMVELWSTKLSRPDDTKLHFTPQDGISDSNGKTYIAGYWQGGTFSTRRQAYHTFTNLGVESANHSSTYGEYRYIDYDGSGNTWLYGYDFSGGTTYEIYRNGILQYTLTDYVTAFNVSSDSSVYYAHPSSSPTVDTIYKAGSATSHRITTNTDERVRSITTDSSGNIYASAYDHVTLLKHSKINTSGVEQWNNTSDQYVSRLECDGNGNLANRSLGASIDAGVLHWLRGSDGEELVSSRPWCGGDELAVMGPWPVLDKS